MLWVLKRTLLLKKGFLALTTYVLVEKYKRYIIYVEAWYVCHCHVNVMPTLAILLYNEGSGWRLFFLQFMHYGSSIMHEVQEKHCFHSKQMPPPPTPRVLRFNLPIYLHCDIENQDKVN